MLGVSELNPFLVRQVNPHFVVSGRLSAEAANRNCAGVSTKPSLCSLMLTIISIKSVCVRTDINLPNIIAAKVPVLPLPDRQFTATDAVPF